MVWIKKKRIVWSLAWPRDGKSSPRRCMSSLTFKTWLTSVIVCLLRIVLNGGMFVCVASTFQSQPHYVDTDKGSCVCASSENTSDCCWVHKCECVFVHCVHPWTQEKLAGVARTTQRLSEIIKQLSANRVSEFYSLCSPRPLFSVRINWLGATVADSWEQIILCH